MNLPASSAAIPRRPLVGMACVAMLGTWMGVRWPSLEASWAAGLGSLLLFSGAEAMASRFRRASTVAAVATHVLLATVFFWTATLAVSGRQAQHQLLRERMGTAQNVTLAGTVTSEPAGRILAHGGARLRFHFRPSSLPEEDRGMPAAPLPIQVDLFGPVSMLGETPPRPMPRGGEGWIFTGRLREYSRRGGLPQAALSVRPGGAQRHPAQDESMLLKLLWNIRRRASRQLEKGMEPAHQSIAVLRAMLLGYRSELPRDLQTTFVESGAIHIFAISGLHVAILATILVAIISLSGISRPYWGWGVLPLLLLYTILTGSRPSAQRAFTMSLFLFGAPMLGRKPDALCSLAAAAILILFASPLQILDPGFTFSFACVAGLLILSPLLHALWPSAVPLDPRDALVQRALHAAGGESRARRLLRMPREAVCRMLAYGRSGLAVSLSVWFASTPLAAMYFGRITPAAIVSNLYAIPLAFLIVLSGCLSLLSGLVSSWLSETLNYASAALVNVLILATHYTASIPGSSFHVTPWPRWAVAGWYAGTALIALALHRRALRIRERAESIPCPTPDAP